MTSLKLYYFDLGGRAEPIRMALTLGKIPFEDIRVTREEHMKMKGEGKWPCGQIPVLEVDGKMLPQSNAILRYAGKLSGFYPEDAWMAAQCDAALDTSGDIVPKIVAVLMAPAD